MPKSHSERITDTVTFIPSTISIPKPSLTDHVHTTSENLIHLLSHKSLPFGTSLKSTTKDNILKLAEILHQDKTPPIKLPALSTPTSVIPTSEGVPTNTSTSTTTSFPVIPNYKDVPVHFVGSIAYYFKEVLQKVAIKYSFTVGKIEKRPVEPLTQYHINKKN